MDPFKQFLQENRNSLDTDSPSEEVWLEINRKMPSPPLANVRRLRFLSVAASLLILIGIGIFVIYFIMPKIPIDNSISKSVQPKPIIMKTSPIDSSPVQNNDTIREVKSNALYSKTIAPKLPKQSSPVQQPSNDAKKEATSSTPAIDEFEKGFVQLINLQKEKINKTPLNAESPAYFNDFNHEIRLIETDEHVLKSEIKKHGLTQDLLARLINIYQQKLNVLKQLQIEIQKTNNRYKQKRNPVDTTKVYFLNI